MATVPRRFFKRSLAVITLCLLGGVIMFSLFGCKKNPRYRIDFGGSEGMYQNAKDSYMEGEKVVLYYPYIATDTDYSFSLDGEGLNYDYDDEHGFVLTFTMPAHDVKLVCHSRNSMVYVPPTEVEEDVLLVDYYRATVATVGGDGYDEMAIFSYTSDEVKLNVYHKYASEGEEQVTHYIVPYEVVDKCLEVIDRYGLRGWSKRKDTYGITGAMIVVKFKDGDDYVRCTSEKMPEDGREAMDAVASVMYGYLSDEYRVDG